MSQDTQNNEAFFSGLIDPASARPMNGHYPTLRISLIRGDAALPLTAPNPGERDAPASDPGRSGGDPGPKEPGHGRSGGDRRACGEVAGGSDQRREEATPRVAPALGNFANLIVSFVGSSILAIIVARLLGPHDYGVYALLTWIIYSINAIAGAAFRMTMTKHVAQYLGARARDVAAATVRAVLSWQTMVGLALAAVLALLARWLPHLAALSRAGASSATLSFTPLELLLTALALPCFLLSGTAIAALQGLQRYDLIALITTLVLPIEIFCSLATLLLGWSVVGLLAIIMVISLLTVVAAVTFAGAWLPLATAPRLSPATRRTLRRYGSSVLVIALFDTVIWQRSEMLFLGYYRTAAEAGFYNLAYTLASTVMSLLPGAIVGVLVPAIARLFTDTTPSAARTSPAPPEGRERAGALFVRSTRYLALLALPLAGIGIAFAPDLLQFVVGRGYLPAAQPLRVLLVSSAIAAIAGSCSAVLYSANQQRFIIMIGAPAAALNLTLDILFIPRFGVMGAAWSNLAAQSCAAIAAFIVAGRFLQVAVPWADVLRVIGGVLLGVAPLWYIYQAALLSALPPLLALFIALLAVVPCCIAALWLTRALIGEDILLVLATLRRVVQRG
jgi:O-antigen/teichoic acid export membrane protein